MNAKGSLLRIPPLESHSSKSCAVYGARHPRPTRPGSEPTAGVCGVVGHVCCDCCARIGADRSAVPGSNWARPPGVSLPGRSGRAVTVKAAARSTITTSWTLAGRRHPRGPTPHRARRCDAAGLGEDGWLRSWCARSSPIPARSGGDRDPRPRAGPLLSERTTARFAERVCVPRRNLVPKPRRCHARRPRACRRPT